MNDTLRLLFQLRNSPDLKLRAIVRTMIRSDVQSARVMRRSALPVPVRAMRRLPALHG